MNPHFERASLLMDRGRFEEAVAEVQQAIQAAPDNPFHLGLLALALSKLDRHQQALEAAARTVEAAPDLGYSHWVLAMVYTQRERLSEARKAIQQAIEFDPEDADFFALLARIEFESSMWQASVTASERGLQLDPSQDVCLHYRSLAMMQLGNPEEAERGFARLMKDDPNDPHTHEAKGWLCLKQGKAEEAKTHFLESLRLNPTNEEARLGLANALKARHVVFGMALKALLYLGRFRKGSLWLIAIAVVAGLWAVGRFVRANPDYYLAAWALKTALYVTVVAIIAANPLFDLILRLDRQGRLAMTPQQVRASNLSAVFLSAALFLGLLYAWRGSGTARVFAWPLIMLPHAIYVAYQCSTEWVRRRMMVVITAAALLIPAGFLCAFVSVFLLLKFKVKTFWLLKLGVLYFPLLSVLLCAFADDIADYLERRRPDSLSR